MISIKTFFFLFFSLILYLLISSSLLMYLLLICIRNWTKTTFTAMSYHYLRTVGKHQKYLKNQNSFFIILCDGYTNTIQKQLKVFSRGTPPPKTKTLLGSSLSRFLECVQYQKKPKIYMNFDCG